MTDELNKRIIANANLTLWCVSVAGPEEVHAAESYEDAVARAEKFNLQIHCLDANNDILCFAYACVWPWSEEDHAESLEAQKYSARRV